MVGTPSWERIGGGHAGWGCGSVGGVLLILLVRGQIEEFPIARVDEKAIETLDQALAFRRVPLGLVEGPGPGEDLATRFDLALLGGFLIAEPDDPVGDLLFFPFKSSDALFSVETHALLSISESDRRENEERTYTLLRNVYVRNTPCTKKI